MARLSALLALCAVGAALAGDAAGAAAAPHHGQGPHHHGKHGAGGRAVRQQAQEEASAAQDAIRELRKKHHAAKVEKAALDARAAQAEKEVEAKVEAQEAREAESHSAVAVAEKREAEHQAFADRLKQDSASMHQALDASANTSKAAQEAATTEEVAPTPAPTTTAAPPTANQLAEAAELAREKTEASQAKAVQEARAVAEAALHREEAVKATNAEKDLAADAQETRAKSHLDEVTADVHGDEKSALQAVTQASDAEKTVHEELSGQAQEMVKKAEASVARTSEAPKDEMEAKVAKFAAESDRIHAMAVRAAAEHAPAYRKVTADRLREEADAFKAPPADEMNKSVQKASNDVAAEEKDMQKEVAEMKQVAIEAPAMELDVRPEGPAEHRAALRANRKAREEAAPAPRPAAVRQVEDRQTEKAVEGEERAQSGANAMIAQMRAMKERAAKLR